MVGEDRLRDARQHGKIGYYGEDTEENRGSEKERRGRSVMLGHNIDTRCVLCN